ncbi:Transformer domain containing protein [Skermanella stibiiresistens SB22]|uniref:Transformer domain containing protein n=1 Tax=Skermanella stibiiresistens SB22 TaxID=1385369 RepID=W9H041_9PROT|nr:SIR2 family protein [Skermanella stibiiresistens]EWY39439.1 Transformer domain containing protein [Skermanella stibiiresistens SB22]
MTTAHTLLAEIAGGLKARQVIPFLGAGVFDLVEGASSIPRSPEELVAALTAKAAVPGRIRRQLTAAAQYIESHKHRRTLETILTSLFKDGVEPTALHRYLAGIPELPLIVDTWYDDTMARALAGGTASWGQIQGMSHPQSLGEWVRYFDAENQPTTGDAAAGWSKVLYKPMGAVTPAGNYLVSDSDYVEVLTEIDIQSPIPAVVQNLRVGRNFLFLGCRFDGEIGRTFARQIIKRSSTKHWAILPGELSKNEAKFVETYDITPVDISLAEAVEVLSAS